MSRARLSSAAAGGDLAYRTQGLRFTPVDPVMDETVPWVALFFLWVRAALVASIVWTVFSIGGLLISVFAGAAGGELYTSATNFMNVFSGSVWLSAVLSFIVFWIVLLLFQVDEPMSEWKVLIDDQAPAAASAYSAIYATLTRRQMPVRVEALRIRSDVLAPEAVNSRLVITERAYSMYVSVFPYGTSMYVGWTMWRRRRGYLLIGHFLKDLVAGLIGRGGSVNQALRTESIRAMREAVHSAVREGVDVTQAGTTVSMTSSFGHELPVQDLRSGPGQSQSGLPQPGLSQPGLSQPGHEPPGQVPPGGQPPR